MRHEARKRRILVSSSKACVRRSKGSLDFGGCPILRIKTSNYGTQRPPPCASAWALFRTAGEVNDCAREGNRIALRLTE